MLSILEALQFSFRKAHVFIWGLFLVLLHFLSFSINIFNENFGELVQRIKKFSFPYLYILRDQSTEFVWIGILCISCFLLYLLISAKKNTLAQESQVSFTKKGILLFFVIVALLFFFKEFWASFWNGWKILWNEYQIYPNKIYFLPEVFCIFFLFLFFAPFVLAYIMQAKGKNYFKCLWMVYKNYTRLNQLFGIIILFISFLIIPFEFLEFVISKMDIQSVLAYAQNSKAGSVLSLFALLLMIGVPMGVWGCFTYKGRWFLVITTAYYFWMYHQMIQAEFSLTFTLYFYLIWLLVSLQMFILTIALPAGVMHLLSQGAVQISEQ